MADVGVDKLVWRSVLTLQLLWILSAAQADKNNSICFATANVARQIPLAARYPGPC